MPTSELKLNLATGMISPDALIHRGLEFAWKAWECSVTCRHIPTVLLHPCCEARRKEPGHPCEDRGRVGAGGQNRDILDDHRNDKISKIIPEDCAARPPAPGPPWHGERSHTAGRQYYDLVTTLLNLNIKCSRSIKSLTICH